MSSLETQFRFITKNPLFLASGIQSQSQFRRSLQNGAGAVICKSLTLEEHKGHETPMVETNGGFLNAVGYSNPGIDAGLEEFNGWNKLESLF